MSRVDYRKAYRLEQSLRDSSDIVASLEEGSSLDSAVDQVMRVGSRSPVYKLHRRVPGEGVRFSSDAYNDTSPEMLVLSIHGKRWEILGSKTTPVVALRYQAVRNTGLSNYSLNWGNFPNWDHDPQNYLGICYVQTMRGIDRDAYMDATEILGSRPHEFIVAQFLSRIAPVVRSRPQTKVVLQSSTLTSRKTIQERFFDKGWRLNPNKERVRQIFGPDNIWLDPPPILR